MSTHHVGRVRLKTDGSIEGSGRRPRKGRFATVVAAVGLLAIGPAVIAPPSASAARGAEDARVIVRLNDLGPGADVRGLADALVGPSGGRLTAVYEHAVQGFAAQMPSAAADALARNPLVAAVTPDQIVSITATDPEVPTGVDRIEGDRNVAGAPVDVDIAILDTGVVAHPDLNVVSTVDCTPWFGLFGCLSGNDGSVHWHATHVAGTAAALDDGNGVEGTAPGARIWSVRVLDSQGSGSLSQLILGIDWVTARAGQIDVANMSLGGSFSDSTFDLAISNSVAAGIVYVVAAGNDDENAAGFSPASHPSTFTVSAIADSDGQPGGVGGEPWCRSDQDDTFADFSNFGAVVDIAAPGVCILSTYSGGGYATASGTSMATPHVAGVVGRYLAVNGIDPTTTADVEAVQNSIVAAAIPQADACGFSGDPDPFAEPLVFLNAVELGGDGSCGASGPADGAPMIDWTTPAEDEVVSGSVAIAATVTDSEDDAANLVVDYRSDGGAWLPMIGSGDTFSASWDSTGAGDGPTTLEIRATDTAANTTTASRDVVVDNLANVAPTADFTADCNGLTCSFDASTSSDPDGEIVGYAWDFGDGSTGTGVTASHTYGASGSPTVSLDVTDNESATGSTSQTVTVVEPTTMEIDSVYAELTGRRNTRLTATVEIGSDGAPVSGAVVEGSFEVNGVWVAATATTGADGVAQLNGGKIKWFDFVTFFCVDSVEKPGVVLTTTVPYCDFVYP